MAARKPRPRPATEKSAQAFRTISEVSETVGVPQHVLRFWETRFAQLKPLKRNGGRRLYRPDHVALLQGIRALLYDDGMTIKGVQKILREQGAKTVAARAGDGPQPVVPPQDATERLAAIRARLDAASRVSEGEGEGPTLSGDDAARVRGSIARLEKILAELQRH